MNRREFFSTVVGGLALARLLPTLAKPSFVSGPLLDELNAVTMKEIWPLAIQDRLFKSTPFMAYVRERTFDPRYYDVSVVEHSEEWIFE